MGPRSSPPNLCAHRTGAGIKALSLALATWAAASCGPSNTYFPDELGNAWTYSVRNGFGAEHVETVKVGRRLTVAGTEGVELTGPLGTSRLAWKGGTLWAESFSNLRVNPPLPLLCLDRKPRHWKGRIATVFGMEQAEAKLSHASESQEMGGRTFETLRCELTIERPVGTTKLITWFAPDVGILKQEQRTRDVLEYGLKWISGPEK